MIIGTEIDGRFPGRQGAGFLDNHFTPTWSSSRNCLCYFYILYYCYSAKHEDNTHTIVGIFSVVFLFCDVWYVCSLWTCLAILWVLPIGVKYMDTSYMYVWCMASGHFMGMSGQIMSLAHQCEVHVHIICRCEQLQALHLNELLDVHALCDAIATWPVSFHESEEEFNRSLLILEGTYLFVIHLS